MRNPWFLTILSLFIFSCNAIDEGADLILINGKILTLNESQVEVSAISISGDRIVSLGGDEEILSTKGSKTEIIDLHGLLAIPGLIEGHGHYMRLGQTLMQLNLMNAKSWDEIVELVEREVQKSEKGDWILGWGWHQDKWLENPAPNIEGLPIHSELSLISPDNPVLLAHTSGHGVFANERAMIEAGIEDDTSNPEGGEIVRDENMQAIGMFRESAADLIKNAYLKHQQNRPKEEIEKEKRLQVQLAAEEALANGITSFQDMGSSFETIDLLKSLADENALPVRLYMAIHDPAELMKDKLAEYRMIGYGNHFLTVRCIGEKVLDGALGTHGGWLLEPYDDLPRSVGFNVTPVDEIRKSAELAVLHNYQMAIQGIGDKASRILFDIYEETFNNNPGQSDWRWRIEHAQVIHPDDLPRFAELGVIAGIQGIFACSDGPWVETRLGVERTEERAYLWREMADSGALIMNGSDPPVEDIDPMASFYCSVSRVLPDGSVFGSNQRLTREQTLKSYTINNAFAAFEEKIKGSLEIGKLADITVLSKDIMTIDEDEIPNAKAVYTIVGGKVKYRMQ